MWRRSMSYVKLFPSASQVGSEACEGSAVATTGTAPAPSGRSETNANARPSAVWPGYTTRRPSGDRSGQPSAYVIGASGAGDRPRVRRSRPSARRGDPETKRTVWRSGSTVMQASDGAAFTSGIAASDQSWGSPVGTIADRSGDGVATATGPSRTLG